MTTTSPQRSSSAVGGTSRVEPPIRKTASQPTLTLTSGCSSAPSASSCAIAIRSGFCHGKLRIAATHALRALPRSGLCDAEPDRCMFSFRSFEGLDRRFADSELPSTASRTVMCIHASVGGLTAGLRQAVSVSPPAIVPHKICRRDRHLVAAQCVALAAVVVH